MAGEHVLAVRRAVLEGLGIGRSTGLRCFDSAPTSWRGSSQPRPTLRGRAGEALRAAEAVARTEALERDPGWVQLVAYGVLVGPRGLLVYRRAKGSGEERLLGKASLGLGGHLEPGDVAGCGEPEDLFTATRAMIREVREELRPSPRWAFGAEPVGLVGDSSTQVGQVHLGFVFRVAFTEPARLDPAPEVVPLGWFGPDRLHLAARNEGWVGAPLEEWSRLVALGSMGQGGFWAVDGSVEPKLDGLGRVMGAGSAPVP
jgi:predicted NUDIX family phosphoesterase